MSMMSILGITYIGVDSAQLLDFLRGEVGDQVVQVVQVDWNGRHLEKAIHINRRMSTLIVNLPFG